MPSDKYSYAKGGFHYENLKNFIVNGCGVESKSDKPNPQYNLTKEFVAEIKQLSQSVILPTETLKEVASKFNVSIPTIRKYYKAYRLLTGLDVDKGNKKKADVREVDYLKIVEERDKLLDKCKQLETLCKINSKELVSLSAQVVALRKETDETVDLLRLAIKTIGYNRWIEIKDAEKKRG